MISRDIALELLHENVKKPGLRKHAYAVEAAMRGLAVRFDGDVEKWGLVGLLHDADWEKTESEPDKHTHETVRGLKEAGETDVEVTAAILSHNYAHTGETAPTTKMEWALYCCDELTGLIVAAALVRPDKKLASVTVDSVLKKFPQKAFAAGVNRDQIAMCEEKLGLSLADFIGMVLKAMQGAADSLGL